MTRRLRVASVMDTWAISGPGRQITALASALSSKGVDLRLFLFQRVGRDRAPFFDYLDRAGVDYVVTTERGAFDPSAFGKFGQALRSWQPDIVQSHHYKPTAFVLGQRLLGFRPAWISFFHGDTTENSKMRLYNWAHGRMVPLADRLVVLSEFHRRQFAHIADRVRLVHNAVLDLPVEGPVIDVSTFRRAGMPLIAVIARLSYEKGVDLLLEALALRHAKGAPDSLVIAGAGPERERLEAQAKQLNISSFVHFVGFVANVVPFYRQLDLVVLPSRNGAEGMPNVLLEALKNDVPVVATAVAGVPEVLTDPLAGAMARPEDVEDLARAMEETLSNGRSEAAREARKETAARFSLERRVETHLGIYRELTSNFA